MGIFTEIVNSLTRPARNTAELTNIINTANKVKRVNFVQDLKTKKIVPVADSGFSKLRDYKPAFTSEKEARAISDNYALQGTKDIANIMSWLVPAGAGVKGLAKSGALSGALGGFGVSEQGKELSGVLTGGLVGGAVGAGVGVAEKGLGKLLGIKPRSSLSEIADVSNKNVDDYIKNLSKTDKNILTSQADALGLINPKGGNVEAVKDYVKYRSVIESSGVKMPNTSAEMIDVAGQALDNIKAQKNDLLANIAKQTIGIDEKTVLKGAIKEKLAKEAITKFKGESQTALDEIFNVIDNANTPTELDNAVQLFYGKVGRFGKNLPKTQEVYRSSAKTIRDFVNGMDKSGQLWKLNDKASTLLEMRPILEKNSALAQQKLGAYGMKTPVRLGPALQKLQSKGAKGAEKVSGATTDLFNMLTSGLQEAKSGGQATQALEAILPFLGGRYASVQGETPEGQDQAIEPSQQSLQMATPTLDPMTNYLQALQMAQQLLPNASVTQVMALAKELESRMSTGGGGAGLTADAKNKLADADAAIAQVQELANIFKEGTGQFGPVRGLAGNIPWATSSKSTKAALDAAAQTVGRFLEGGKLTDKDIERYRRDILPKLTDTPQVAQAKLERLIRNVYTTRQALLDSYSGTGGETDQQDALRSILGTR